MTHRFDQGFLSHTTTARPFWAADVDVSRLHDAPPLHHVRSRRHGSSGGIGKTLARMLAAVTGR